MVLTRPEMGAGATGVDKCDQVAIVPLEVVTTDQPCRPFMATFEWQTNWFMSSHEIQNGVQQENAISTHSVPPPVSLPNHVSCPAC